MIENNIESLLLETTLTSVKHEILKHGKPVLVVSDIDDTLANTYHFDAVLQTHVPHIASEVITYAQNLRLPLLLATGRPNTDPVVSSVWRLLSKPNFPIIVENGGVIFNPETNVTQILATSEQVALLDDVKHSLSQRLDSLLNIAPEDEVVIDTSRFTSIEVRIQNRLTKIGSPNIHAEAAKVLKDIVHPIQLVAISSGSSVSIHPPDISKGMAVLALLPQLSLQRTDVTLLALGDNHNDSPLFSIADISIGVGKDTLGQAQFVCPLGEVASVAVLKLAGECEA